MKNYPLWKSIIVILVIGAGIIFAIPSIIYSENPSNWFLDNKVNLGLDLQGGSYLLLEVETDVLLKEELENISDTVRQISRNEKVNITNVIVEENSELTLGKTIVDWLEVTKRPKNCHVITNANTRGFFSLLKKKISLLP